MSKLNFLLFREPLAHSPDFLSEIEGTATDSADKNYSKTIGDIFCPVQRKVF